jgi:TRAP-type C4-dicarboxylate transport system substrate-binding protein
MTDYYRISSRLIGLLAVCSIFLTPVVSPSEAITLKIATLSPDGSMWMKMIRDGAKEVARQTDQRVKFKFYPGGVMGDDKAVMRKIRIGQLQGGVVTAGTLSGAYRDVQAYHLPIIFNSLDEVDYVRSRMDPTLVKGMYEGGFVTFGLAEGGFAYIMSKQPILSTEDLRKQKVWIPADDPISLETAAVFKLKPIPLGIPEVRTALQTGLIDTITTSPIAAIALQWHTQVNYISDTPLIYLYALLAIDRRAFERISAEDQALVRQVMEPVWKKIDQKNRLDNAAAFNAMQNQGIRVVKPQLEEQRRWKRLAAEVPKRMIESGQISRDIMTQIENHLRDFRVKKSAAVEKN